MVHPGEEFSFNSAVGQRTEAKGYQGAAAYNNGEVVQEIPVKTAPDYIIRQDGILYVRTYDTNYTFMIAIE